MLTLIRDKLSNEEIAAQLGISLDGVKYHVSEILGKLGVRNRREAARWRAKEGRPWWQAALAPLAFWRRLSLSRIAVVAAAALGIIVIAALGALIWGLMATAGDQTREPDSESASAASLPSPTEEPTVEILSVQPFSGAGAWLVTERALMRTDDGGRTWVDRTPVPVGAPFFGAPLVATAYFLDGSRGWITTDFRGSPPAVTIFRTSDGGQTWNTYVLRLDPLEGRLGGARSLFFWDSNTGWLGVSLVSGAAFNFGALYRTTDGGETWQEVTIPSAYPVRFTSPRDGWFAGDPPAIRLYATRDGGFTWQEQSLPGPAPEHPSWNTVALPHFFDPLNGVLGVQVRHDAEEGSLLYFYRTEDGGTNWTPAGEPLRIGPVGDLFVGESRSAAFVTPEDWFVSAERLYATNDAGASWSVVDADLDLAVTHIAFATPERGWGIRHSVDCIETDSCLQRRLDGAAITDEWRLLRTDDGGRTWADVAMP